MQAARPYGLLAQFDHPAALCAAARRARGAGFRRIDAFSAFPIDGLAEALGFADNRVPLLTLAGGIIGAASGLGMQVYTNLAYPLNVGGRPLLAWPAFALITFELMVLGAVGFGIIGMLLLNRLPRLHHPLFDVAEFHLATDDRFFLLIRADDPRFDPSGTLAFLRELAPRDIAEVPA